MAHDLTLPVRRACLKHLKDSAPVTDLVPADQIHPGRPPRAEWPFVTWAMQTTTPLRVPGCADGAIVSFRFHCFARPRVEDGATVETAEDRAAKIGAAVAKALGGVRLALEGGGHVKVTWDGAQLLRDGADADAWHSIQNFTGRALA